MRRLRFQLSRALLAMTLSTFFGILSILPERSVAQSGCTGTLVSESYSNTFSSTTGNVIYNWNFPLFTNSLGTLEAVTLRSTVTTTDDMYFTNNTGTAQMIYSQIYRTDNISTADGTTYNQSAFGKEFSQYLNPGGYASFPSKTTINKEQIVDSLYVDEGDNVSGFTTNTSGTDALKYQSGYELLTSPINQVAAGVTTYTESINMSVTYYYCVIVLPIDLLSFTANRENQQSVMVAWSVADEVAGQMYHVQVSTNGTNYTDAGSVNSDPVNSNASYTYTYGIPDGATGRLFFRLRMVDIHGVIRYSQLAIVNLNANAATGFSIYPNPPADFVNIIFPAAGHDWQVDLLAADGRLVQRNFFHNVNAAQMNFQQKFSAGAYFVHATDMQSANTYVAPMLVR